ncbi:LysR family transcriptional regulator [uncultured Oscillibacter sp.]|uniref:LysR family transcriptional regulator n=1 Tax=uncultured Oscillibacter sp. TaxID=876091 RepID=UPI00261F0A2C|nr:LysR family transcriptional regulator [uncultured Oscillibacter sp.]
MTIQQMRYFLAVIYAGSVSKAARQMYTTQSTVSVAIQNIESEFGFEIFKRSSSGIDLTERGASLAVEVKRILQQVDMLNAKYADHTEQRMEFSVATQHHMPGIDALCRLIREHMHIEERYSVNFSEMRTTEVLDAVSTGKYDVGILFLIPDSKNFLIHKLRLTGTVFNHIAYKPIHVYLRQGHPLAGGSVVYEEDLKNYPRVFYDRDIDTDTIFTDALQRYSSRAINVNDRAAAYMMLQELDAFILGSGYRTSSERQGGILAIPVADCGTWEVGYLLKSKVEDSLLTREFLALFQEELERD